MKNKYGNEFKNITRKEFDSFIDAVRLVHRSKRIIIKVMK